MQPLAWPFIGLCDAGRPAGWLAGPLQQHYSPKGKGEYFLWQNRDGIPQSESMPQVVMAKQVKTFQTSQNNKKKQTQFHIP